MYHYQSADGRKEGSKSNSINSKLNISAGWFCLFVFRRRRFHFTLWPKLIVTFSLILPTVYVSKRPIGIVGFRSFADASLSAPLFSTVSFFCTSGLEKLNYFCFLRLAYSIRASLYHNNPAAFFKQRQVKRSTVSFLVNMSPVNCWLY